MMQGVAKTQQLRSTLHSSQHIVCRSSAARSAPRRAYSAIRASENNQNGTGSIDSDEKRTTVAESISKESDIVFLLRLISISFAGGAAIKYGSLVAELPGAPNGPAALAIVCTPPAIYAGWMLLQRRD
ncbi:hypothetical protein Ndes2526B_g05808 [Nannochloris sp. 'desiccata']